MLYSNCAAPTEPTMACLLMSEVDIRSRMRALKEPLETTGVLAVLHSLEIQLHILSNPGVLGWVLVRWLVYFKCPSFLNSVCMLVIIQRILQEGAIVLGL